MIIAGIVTYNPDLTRLDENIKSIQPQVDKVVVFDNGSDNFLDIREQLENGTIDIIDSTKNVGLGKALNEIFQFAIEQGADWVITLDQDSVCPINYLECASRYMNDINIGIIVPRSDDHNMGIKDMKESDRKKTEYIKRCITSASIIRTDVYKKVGGYDEMLFVDYVDFDFSIRVYLDGYKILKLNDVNLNHELGQTKKKKILFWNFRYTEHNPYREYLIGRNIIIYIKRYGNSVNVFRDFLSLCKHFVLIFVYDKQKKEKLMCLKKGVREGIMYKGD